MATIPTPTRFQRVQVRYRRVRGRVENPYNLKAQTQLWSGKQYLFGFNVAPMKLANAGTWKSFLRALADGETFTLDVSQYTDTGVNTPMTLELVEGSVAWEVDVAKIVHIAFEAQEVK